jgi:glucosamine--fructose-6-phosphate aminotransferase (isomerizing)
MAPVVDRLTGAGARVLRVGAHDEPGRAGDGLSIAADGLPEELLPILEILPLQRLAWHLAVDRGADPDHPRGLSKVTRTW